MTTASNTALAAIVMPTPDEHHDARVAEREEEAGAQRPLPSAISLRVELSIAAM